MANKKLEVSLNSAVSEVTLNKVLVAANIKKNAADVVRDINGKVIKVIIMLPASASASAKAAILATPGVADIQESDIITGMVGWDGTEIGLANLVITEGMRVNNSGVLLTYNADGTVTFSPDLDFMGSNAYSIVNNGRTPLALLPCDMEVKIKAMGTGGTTAFTFHFADSAFLLNCMVTKESGGRVYTYFWGTLTNGTHVDEALPSGGLDPAVPHTFKISSNGILGKLYIDDVEVASGTLVFTYQDYNEVMFGIGRMDGSSATVILDYVRWTQLA